MPIPQLPPAPAPPPEPPPDLAAALGADPAADAQWHDLTAVARMDFITWIESAKRAETRAGRVAKAASMLAAGKRRPCCYSIVSLDLHLTLKPDPAAKAAWSAINPFERRYLIRWMDEEKDPARHRQRIATATTRLAIGHSAPPPFSPSPFPRGGLGEGPPPALTSSSPYPF